MISMSYERLTITLTSDTLQKIDELRKTPHGDVGRSTVIESLLEQSLKGGSKQQ